jgi:hypothetical protein
VVSNETPVCGASTEEDDDHNEFIIRSGFAGAAELE